jgi:glycosyltransferase involved in cell wall biosynthesis
MSELAASTPVALPGVSIVVPVLDEERHLEESVARLLGQRYAGPLEVVLALGPSTDGTDAIAGRLAAADPRLRFVPNPTGRTPAGLNAAIAAATYDVIVRCDGHALVPDDYVSVAVEVLERTGADNVGGMMAAEGTTPFERAVAAAMTSKLGVGSASFHTGGDEGEALTVYLGAFRRAAIDRVGGYDETMVRAQDWEMNHRIRESGGLIWFTPGMQVTYRPRSTVRALAKQYLEYGRWRREVVRRYPDTISLRYLAAPLAVTGFAVGTAAGIAAAAGAPSWLALGWLAPVGYAALVTVGGIAAARDQGAEVAVRLPLVLATMHGSWGFGFLTSPRSVAKQG